MRAPFSDRSSTKQPTKWRRCAITGTRWKLEAAASSGHLQTSSRMRRCRRTSVLTWRRHLAAGAGRIRPRKVSVRFDVEVRGAGAVRPATKRASSRTTEADGGVLAPEVALCAVWRTGRGNGKDRVRRGPKDAMAGKSAPRPRRVTTYSGQKARSAGLDRQRTSSPLGNRPHRADPGCRLLWGQRRRYPAW